MAPLQARRVTFMNRMRWDNVRAISDTALFQTMVLTGSELLTLNDLLETLKVPTLKKFVASDMEK